MPAGTAAGVAMFSITNGGVMLTASGMVRTTAPAIFSAASNGYGAAAASIDVPVYVVLYGTGIRGSTSPVTVTINGTPATVTYAGAQGGFVGLDQINVQIPANVKAAGESNFLVTVDGVTANAITVVLK